MRWHDILGNRNGEPTKKSGEQLDEPEKIFTTPNVVFMRGGNEGSKMRMVHGMGGMVN